MKLAYERVSCGTSPGKRSVTLSCSRTRCILCTPLQAAKAKAGRFVYVSVSNLVPEAFGGIALQGYVVLSVPLRDQNHARCVLERNVTQPSKYSTGHNR